MRKSLIAANWKMNGSLAKNALLLKALKAKWRGQSQLVIFPPCLYLGQLCELLKDTAIAWGAQDIGGLSEGALTGAVSASMVAEFGARYVIVGHSERRQWFHETDALITKKCQLAYEVGLIPIICVGENLAEREAGQTLTVIDAQLDPIFASQLPAKDGVFVIAYEPVWAIGTGQTATLEQAAEVHAHIRESLKKEDLELAMRTQILYGGSINKHSASVLFSDANIDGGLVGGASLDAEEFLAICQAAG